MLLVVHAFFASRKGTRPTLVPRKTAQIMAIRVRTTVMEAEDINASVENAAIVARLAISVPIAGKRKRIKTFDYVTTSRPINSNARFFIWILHW